MVWYLYAFGAAILTAASAIIQKKTLNKEHAMEFSASLAIINFVLAIYFFPKTNFDVPFQMYLIMYVASWFGSVAFLMVAKALRHMPISSSSPILNFGPAITTIFAFFFLGEKISLLQTTGIGLLILGAYVLEIRGSLKNFLDPFKKLTHSKYSHFIFFALILYGFSALTDRYVVSNGVDVQSYMFIIHFFLMFNFLIMMSVFHDGVRGIVRGFRNAGWWIVLIGGLTVGYRYLQIEAVSMIYVGLVVSIKRTATLFSTIIGGLIYHEKNLLVKVLGCIIMLWGAVFIII